MTLLSAPWYRVRQFAKVARGKLNAAERREAAEVLSPPLMRLFLSMRGIAQRHGYDVFRTLKSQGYTDRDLLAGALLHDVGKGRLGVVSRVLWVLLGKLGPQRQQLVSSPVGRWLGFWQNYHHSALGGELVARAEGSLITVWLVRHHDLRGHVDPLLRVLQAADDDN